MGTMPAFSVWDRVRELQVLPERYLGIRAFDLNDRLMRSICNDWERR